MPTDLNEIRNRLVDKGLKVTPQRMAVLKAVLMLDNHPSVEIIIEYIRKNHPNISTATVYKVLETFVSCRLIKRVKTEVGIMRYDAIIESHHHLYCSESDRIEDYNDDELNRLLETYFAAKGIPDFKIEDIKLQIMGRFLKNKS